MLFITVLMLRNHQSVGKHFILFMKLNTFSPWRFTTNLEPFFFFLIFFSFLFLYSFNHLFFPTALMQMNRQYISFLLLILFFYLAIDYSLSNLQHSCLFSAFHEYLFFPSLLYLLSSLVYFFLSSPLQSISPFIFFLIYIFIVLTWMYI